MRALALLLGLAVGLLAAELTVRVFGLAPSLIPIEVESPWGAFVTSPNPVLQYVPRPGSADINRYGIRDYDYPIEKPDGVFRIVVIGDSFGFGLCIDSLGDTFPKLVERDLQALQLRDVDRVEVINLSVSGYDTTQEVEFLKEKGLALSPDLVLVGFVLNDYYTSSLELIELRKEDGWQRNQIAAAAIRRSAITWSHLARLVAGSLPPLREQLPFLAGDGSGGRKRVKRAFAALGALGESHGFSVVVAIFPSLSELGLGDRADYPFHRRHQSTARLAEAAGFSALDLYPAFEREAWTNPASVRCDDGHPNERGHVIAARAIAAHLRKRLLR